MTCRLCNDGWPLIVCGGEMLHDLPEPAGMFRCEEAAHYAPHYATSEPPRIATKIDVCEDNDAPPCFRRWTIHYSDGTLEETTDLERIRALIPFQPRSNWRD